MNRVVLVDPDELSRRVAATQLRERGSRVIEADEQEALALLRNGAETVVVWNAKDTHGLARLLAALDPVTQSSLPGPELRPVMVGESTGMRDLRAHVRRLARNPRLHVLVAGEIGTGKQTFARALHAATGLGVLVRACASRFAALLDANLGELAELGGTLYVPSIVEIPRAEQRRLAERLHERELQSGAPPLRVVLGARLDNQGALAHIRRHVEAALASRLAVSLEVSPLRRRRCDIGALVSHFLEVHAASAGTTRPRLSDEALRHLQQHHWPGNLRELANVVDQAALSAGSVIETAHLPAFSNESSEITFELPENGVDLGELERVVLEQALRRARGNQTRAASLLGLTRDQIRYRMSKFGMERGLTARRCAE